MTRYGPARPVFQAGAAWTIVPIALAILGAVVPLVGSNYPVWVSLAWLAALAEVLIARSVIRLTPPNRAFVDRVLLAVPAISSFPLGALLVVLPGLPQPALPAVAAGRTASLAT